MVIHMAMTIRILIKIVELFGLGLEWDCEDEEFLICNFQTGWIKI